MNGDERVWSKKMDNTQGKYKKVDKNLGSAANYIEDDMETRYQVKNQEKIAYILEDDAEEKNLKDKANIKYNYQDFLSQF